MGVDPVRRDEATRAFSRTRSEPASSRTVLSSVARSTSSSCGERTMRGVGGRRESARAFTGRPTLGRFGTAVRSTARSGRVRGPNAREAHPVEFLGRRRVTAAPVIDVETVGGSRAL